MDRPQTTTTSNGTAPPPKPPPYVPPNPNIRHQIDATRWYIPCLPDGIYPSRQASIDAANAFALPLGYSYTISTSYRTLKGGRTKIHLSCSRAGVKQNGRGITDETRRRKRKSVKCGCPQMLLLKDNENGLWTLEDVGEGTVHNHPWADNPDEPTKSKVRAAAPLFPYRLSTPPPPSAMQAPPPPPPTTSAAGTVGSRYAALSELRTNEVEDTLSTYWFLRWQSAMKEVRELRARSGVHPQQRQDGNAFQNTYPLLSQAMQSAAAPALMPGQAVPADLSSLLSALDHRYPNS